MTEGVFEVLLLLARPAAGKSEIIQYLNGCDEPTRRQRFHIGAIDVIDDFPMLWEWFEEDAILEELGHPRLHTTPDGLFIDAALWDLLMRKIDLAYTKRLRDALAGEPLSGERTTLIEFARGSQHGGFARAFAHLSREIASRAAILYVDVSWEESLRKNRKRFNPARPDSILEHGLPDQKMELLYRESDWAELAAAHPEGIPIQGRRVPFAVFENADDVTTRGGEELGARLEAALSDLWRRYHPA